MTADATRRQNAAADPAGSVWLSANAGSGKTRVLTDRVARLLLDGAPPENILCLTYTKAAAGEMQNRLFDRLGRWSMMPDIELQGALDQLGVPGPLGTDRLAAARRLFARAIEAPGGLKIQTIHAFAASLLRLFPREAGVAPNFTELDDLARRLLIDEVLDTLSSGPEAPVIDGVAAHLSQDDDIHNAVAGILTYRAAFSPGRDLSAWQKEFGLPAGCNEERLISQSFTPLDTALLRRVATALDPAKTTEAKAVRALQSLTSDPITAATLAALEDIFLFKSGAKAFRSKAGSFPTKATRAALGADMAALDDLMDRVETARGQRIALAAARRNAALQAFADAFLPCYDAAKALRGALDFDDLIRFTHALLSDPGVADWVLYRLDGRLDHILVDEAQDTNPAQWQIISLLARELTVGVSARDASRRTLFVVGDQKQSIYSFQGADPAEFARMEADFSRRLRDAGLDMGGEPLLHSFRSAPAILDLVDATFRDGPPGVGVTEHRPGRTDLPGRVDLWPMVEPAETPPNPAWYEPVDRIQPSHEFVQLADFVAGEVRRLIDSGETVPDGTGGRRLLSAGDVLILVQKRSGALFPALLAACKSRGLDVAGADRLRLLDDLAVRDLLALLNFLALPEDDLSLAVTLRSPLFGWSEDQLYRLAQPRKGYLWAALREDLESDETYRALRSLRDVADYLRPYDLIDRILTRHGGRARLLARLGADVEDAIDALLAEALAYERSEVPSLTGFLVWITAENAEIKRQAEARGSKLRIMTVHGAKGLEAPVVILPDCGPQKLRRSAPVLLSDDGWPFWPVARADAPPSLAAAADAARDRDAAERDRLLYVAMTRAETWLIVCAAGHPDKAAGSWHARIGAGMDRLDAAPLKTPGGSDGRRYATGDWSAGPTRAATVAPRSDILPDWISRPAPAVPPHSEIRQPSALGGAKALPGDGALPEKEAKLRGTRLHRLLEYLPRNAQAGWPALAASLLAEDDAPTDPEEIDALLSEATAVLTNPDLRALFAPATLAEVDLTAHIPSLGGRIHGILDRLIVAPDRITAVDFKSNAVVPLVPEDTPEGLLRQMGAYAEALAQIYPQRTIETAILWTRTARLMPLPHALVNRALRTTDMSRAHLDAPHVGA